VSQEADLAWLLGLGGRFILASGDYSGNSQWGTGFDNPQNQSPAVAPTNRKFHPASTHEEHSSWRLPFREQNRSRGIAGGKRFILHDIGYRLRKIAKRIVYWRKFLGIIYDLCSHMIASAH
jgi:hypothetical protein